MFGMALTKPSSTMQLTSGMDVFGHVCGQKVGTSSNYCDNIQPYDKRSAFVKFDTIFRLCFGNYYNFILLNFAR